MYRLCFIVILHTVAVGTSRGEDQIAADLAKAKASHQEKLMLLKNQAIELIKTIIQREQGAGVVPNFMLKELKGFEEGEVVPILPKLLPASRMYLDGKKIANEELEKAFEAAIEAYRKASVLDKAIAVRVELKQHRERMAPTNPKDKPLPPLVVREDSFADEYDWRGKSLKRSMRSIRIGDAKLEFVLIPRGDFVMGSSDNDKDAESDEKPPHKVTFTYDLWIAKNPITREQFAAFCKATGYETDAERDGKGGFGFNVKSGNLEGPNAQYTWKNPGWQQTDKHPVVNVSWNDAQAFCSWAAQHANRKIRLLTEAENEYACRAGTTTRFYTGDTVESLRGFANVSDLSAKTRFSSWPTADFDDGFVFTSPVAAYKPNAFGLHDMAGNVWCWCGDWDKADLYKRGPITNPLPNIEGEKKQRILRGGSWDYTPLNSRSADRNRHAPSERHYSSGFTVCFRVE